MPDVTFFVVKPNYLYVSYFAHDERVRRGIGEKIDKDTLNVPANIPKAVRTKMGRIRQVIEKWEGDSNLAGKPVLAADINLLIDKELHLNVRVGNVRSIGEALSEYCGKIKEGQILHKGKVYAPAIQQQLNAIASHIPRNLQSKSIELITVSDIETIKKGILSKKLSQNTVSTYVMQLLHFIERTRKMKWHNNKLYEERKEMTVPQEASEAPVFITPAEQQKLLGMSFARVKRAESRDLFVLGCNLGLRAKDLLKLDVQVVRNGQAYMLTQKKKTDVIIPLNAQAKAILDKYPKGLPRPSYCSFNCHVKEICKEAGFDELVQYTITKGGVTNTHNMARHELMGTHTMRRSFATNAYLAGVPTISVMKITGHKTESSFMKYIRISNQENADHIASHPFFK